MFSHFSFEETFLLWRLTIFIFLILGLCKEFACILHLKTQTGAGKFVISKFSTFATCLVFTNASEHLCSAFFPKMWQGKSKHQSSLSMQPMTHIRSDYFFLAIIYTELEEIDLTY